MYEYICILGIAYRPNLFKRAIFVLYTFRNVYLNLKHLICVNLYSNKQNEQILYFN